MKMTMVFRFLSLVIPDISFTGRNCREGGPASAFWLLLGFLLFPCPQSFPQIPPPGSISDPVGVPVPGQTIAPGQVPAPGPVGVPVPGQTIAPGQVPIPGPMGVPVPGQTIAPGQVPIPGPVGVPVPGQTIAPGQVPIPGPSGVPVIPAPAGGVPVQPAATGGGTAGTGNIPRVGAVPEEAVQAAAGVLSLDEALGRIGLSGLELHWDPFFGTGTFIVAGHTLAFDTGSPGETGFILLDFREIFPVPVPFVRNGLLWFPEPFIAALKRTLDAFGDDDRSRFRIAAIVVDPGHGGKDPGAVGNHVINGKPLRVMEKDVTLATSKFLHARLSEAYPNKRILLTREGDTYPTLEERVAIANSTPLKDNEAIVFVSIHANASFNREARGFEVWYLSPEYRRTVIDGDKYADSAEVIPILNAMLEEEFTTESIMMAQSLVRRVAEDLGNHLPSRGIKAEEWFVVRNARMPSVLVELGFVSNREDALFLSDEVHLRSLADSLYKGIADFVAAFEGTGGFTAIR